MGKKKKKVDDVPVTIGENDLYHLHAEDDMLEMQASLDGRGGWKQCVHPHLYGRSSKKQTIHPPWAGRGY